MIYLDNSASTITKPKEVIKAVEESLLHFSANPGRSGHQASIKTALMVEEVREQISAHFNNGSSEKVIFTHNCTHALNLAILGSAKKGGHVICTENEHNSVLRPLEHLRAEGTITYSIAFQSDKRGIVLNDIAPLVQDNTYLIVCNHISNVNGDKAEIEEIGKFCKEHNIIFLVDCAQSAGHEKIDMQKMNIDMLAFAGHKGFYAPQSVGSLVINGDIHLSPILFGGTGTNSLELFQPELYPERLESGTISTPLILGLGAGIKFVEENFEEIKAKLDDLTTFLNYELRKLGVDVYTEPENANGVIAFNIPNLSSSDVATLLDEHFGLCVRGGLHCAPFKHKALGTIEQGAVRVSLSYFNTVTHAQKLLSAVKYILRKDKSTLSKTLQKIESKKSKKTK